MKIYDKIIFVLGILFNLIPLRYLYKWVELYDEFYELGRKQTVLIFDREVMFGLFNDGLPRTFPLLMAVIAELLLMTSLVISLQKQDKFVKVKTIVFIVSLLLFISTLWGFL